MVAGVAGVLAALALVLAVSITVHGSGSRRGCIEFSLAYSTGGDRIQRCGAAARGLCSTLNAAGGLTGQPARVVARACRRARLPVG
ncbi:MAG: hypothetical protein ACRDL5_04025 [Solirubrobacteraceae bacterium]